MVGEFSRDATRGPGYMHIVINRPLLAEIGGKGLRIARQLSAAKRTSRCVDFVPHRLSLTRVIRRLLAHSRLGNALRD